MKKYFLEILTCGLFLFGVFYVAPKSPDFPPPHKDFVQSFEPADIETPMRRGYYTNLTREEVMNYYIRNFNNGFNYTLRLNYPPESAQSIIRDQTKSTYLEEIVHPLRESVYINGFEPPTPEYALVINGVNYGQKIIIKYVPSSLIVRLFVVLLSSISFYVLTREILYAKKQA